MALGFFLLAGYGAYCSARGRDPAVVASRAADQAVSDSRTADAREIGEAEYAVQQTLRDPSSARFDNVIVVRNPGSVAVCGTVNAKNGFGGYTGPARFMARNQAALIETPRNARDFSRIWNRACVPQ